jgi:hypothetical protein
VTFLAVPETDLTLLSGSTNNFSYGPNTETCTGQGARSRLLYQLRFQGVHQQPEETSLARFSCRKALSIASTIGSRRKSRSSRGAARSGHGRSTFPQIDHGPS